MRVGLVGEQMPQWPAATRRANRPLVGRLVREVQRHKRISFEEFKFQRTVADCITRSLPPAVSVHAGEFGDACEG
jgi:hypothetical protein